MTRYRVEVTRDGRWWMISVPEIDQITQARRISEIDEMARSLISLMADEPLNEVELDIVGITVPGVGDIQRSAQELVHMREEAAIAAQKAQQRSASFVRQLTEAGIPVRDAGELLGLSPQRISQLSS